MKIVIIHGQSHEGTTCHIARMLAEKLRGEVTEFFLPRDFGEFCKGCTVCFTRSETLCPHAAALRPLTEAMDAADVILLASPVYVYHATGAMKAFLDHYGYRWMVHRPEEKMFSKQAVVISTAAGAGMKSAIKDVADSCFFWGIPRVYKYGKAVMEARWDHVKPEIKKSIEAKTDSIAKKILSYKGGIPLKTRGMFFIMSMMQRNGFNEADAGYWKEKGWTSGKRPWK